MRSQFVSFRRSVSLIRSYSTRAEIVLDPSVETWDQLKQRLKQNRRPNGASEYKVPDELAVAFGRAVQQWPQRLLAQHATKLNQFLSTRPLPLKSHDALNMAVRLEDKFAATHSDGAADDAAKFVSKSLRVRAKQWRPTEIRSPFSAAVYTMARLPILYATSVYCLHELRRIDPEFVPDLVLDHNSGPSAVLWAVRNLWPSNNMFYVGVEPELALQNLAHDMLPDTDHDVYNGISFRSFLSTAASCTHSLVVSSHGLCELASQKDRAMCMRSLWRSVKVGGYLVLIENGTSSGFETLVEARRSLLRRRAGGRWQACVIAPCPHQLGCPRLGGTGASVCHFRVPYHPLRPDRCSVGAAPLGHAKFSYLIVQKRDDTTASTAAATSDHQPWCRIVQPVLVRKHQRICRLCTYRGRIEEVVVTKQNHSRPVYNAMKRVVWGDAVPFILRDAKPASSELPNVSQSGSGAVLSECGAGSDSEDDCSSACSGQNDHLWQHNNPSDSPS